MLQPQPLHVAVEEVSGEHIGDDELLQTRRGDVAAPIVAGLSEEGVLDPTRQLWAGLLAGMVVLWIV